MLLALLDKSLLQPKIHRHFQDSRYSWVFFVCWSLKKNKKKNSQWICPNRSKIRQHMESWRQEGVCFCAPKVGIMIDLVLGQISGHENFKGRPWNLGEGNKGNSSYHRSKSLRNNGSIWKAYAPCTQLVQLERIRTSGSVGLSVLSSDVSVLDF